MNPQMFELSLWVDHTGTDKDLCLLLDQYIAGSGHTILGTVEHAFTPQGYTCLWLLAESHIAVHTYPEHQKAYIQLSSCSQPKFLELAHVLYTRMPGVEKYHKNESILELQK